MDVLVRFDTDHLSRIEKPTFFRNLNSQIADDELFCNTAIKVAEDRLEEVRPVFENWDVPIEIYHITEVDHHDRL